MNPLFPLWLAALSSSLFRPPPFLPFFFPPSLSILLPLTLSLSKSPFFPLPRRRARWLGPKPVKTKLSCASSFDLSRLVRSFSMFEGSAPAVRATLGWPACGCWPKSARWRWPVLVLLLLLSLYTLVIGRVATWTLRVPCPSTGVRAEFRDGWIDK